MFQQPEIILSAELSDLLLTETDCSPINTIFIHREMKRDGNNKLLNCPACNPKDNGRIEGQKTCPYCKGVGVLFKDSIKKGYFYSGSLEGEKKNLHYSSPAGRYDTYSTTLVTTRDTSIKKYDIILMPVLTENGLIKVPIEYMQKYNVYFDKPMTASGKNSDFNVAILGR